LLLQKRAVDVVRKLHQALIERMDQEARRGDGPPAEHSDAYVLKLERTIEELSTGQAELPPDDFQQTDLCNHIAGDLVRSRIVRCLIERSGLTVESLRGSNERAGWQRLRTLLHEREQELEAAVLKVQKGLRLERSNDLSEQMKLVEDEFWASWEAVRRDLP